MRAWLARAALRRASGGGGVAGLRGGRRRRWALRCSSRTFRPSWRAPGLYLEDLYVRPDKRGRGLGRALLTRLAQSGGGARLRTAGLVRARLECENAIGFYKKLGARIMEDWRTCRVTGDSLASAGRKVADQFWAAPMRLRGTARQRASRDVMGDEGDVLRPVPVSRSKFLGRFSCFSIRSSARIRSPRDVDVDGIQRRLHSTDARALRPRR